MNHSLYSHAAAAQTGQMQQQFSDAQSTWLNKVAQDTMYPTTQTAPPSGMMVDAGSVMARLSDIRDRIVRLNDRLNGYRPTDGCETKATPHEPDTMRRLIDRSMMLATEIEVELNVIEAKI